MGRVLPLILDGICLFTSQANRLVVKRRFSRSSERKNSEVFRPENRFQTSGRVEHMFVEVHEEIELKLTAMNYIMMPNIDSKCTEDPDKSISKVLG